MNACATCKHWEEIGGGLAACNRITDDNDSAEEASVNGMDGAVLYTRADFGCTLWQARDGVLGNMMTDGRSSWPKESK